MQIGNAAKEHIGDSAICITPDADGLFLSPYVEMIIQRAAKSAVQKGEFECDVEMTLSGGSVTERNLDWRLPCGSADTIRWQWTSCLRSMTNIMLDRFPARNF